MERLPQYVVGNVLSWAFGHPARASARSRNGPAPTGLPIAAQMVWETTVGKTVGHSAVRPTPYSLSLIEGLVPEVRIQDPELNAPSGPPGAPPESPDRGPRSTRRGGREVCSGADRYSPPEPAARNPPPGTRRPDPRLSYVARFYKVALTYIKSRPSTIWPYSKSQAFKGAQCYNRPRQRPGSPSRRTMVDTSTFDSLGGRKRDPFLSRGFRDL
jgi:hypothetical protein